MAGVKLAEGTLAKIADKLRRIPVPPGDGFFSRRPGDAFGFDAIITAIAPASNPPKYTIRAGHWESPSSTSQGTWTDDSGAMDSYAYALDPRSAPYSVGAYVRCAYAGTDSSDPPVPYYVIFGGGDRAQIVRVATAATAGGMYNGYLCVPPGSDVPAGANLAGTDFGTDGDAILITNAKEVGQTTHDLTDAANTYDFYAPAVYLRTNSTGVKVYGIDKVFIGCKATVTDDPAFDF